ncbi:MAG: hypothetical protein KJ556_21795 [Gammaproteobacteria bacterium]|nr:hypothetical protein [Gammaproteobacteria bacterium]
MNLTIPPTARGCGKRRQGGLYACVGLAAGGRPISEFMIDPPILWTQGAFRGTRIEPREDGVVDLVQWVGEAFYPFVPDFVEEGSRFGFSRLLSPSIDLTRVVPYQSRILFIHSRAYVNGSYTLQERNSAYPPHPDLRALCAHGIHKVNSHSPCVFATWELSALTTMLRHRVEADGDLTRITIPSAQYSVQTPISAKVDYRPALFLALPLTHFEVIGKGLTEQQEQRLGDNVSFTATMKE